MKTLMASGRSWLGLLAVVFGMVGYIMPTQTASAAGCDSAGEYGSVVVRLPQLARTGGYNIWVRMQTADSTHNKVLLEINQRDCLTITSTQPIRQWAWVPYSSDGTNPSAYDFTQVAENTAKVIGIESGVKIDKVMVAPPGCIPSGADDQCVRQSPDKPMAQNSVATATPLTNGPVSGSVYPTATIQQNEAVTTSISYSSDGRLVQTVEGAGKFDTTLVENGKHTITIRTTFTNGNVREETTIIEVDNPETVMTPVIRPIRQHLRSIQLVSAVLLSLILIWLLWTLIKIRYQKKRYLDFHGF